MNQYFFIWFIIVVHLVTVKMFDICLWIGSSITVFILLVNIFNHTFNLFINNIVRKRIIDESLFHVFYLFIKYCFGGGDQFGAGYQVINNYFFLYLKGHSLLKLRVEELLFEGFFVSRGSEVVIFVRINENI